MYGTESRIAQGDITLFDRIPSQTSVNDKKALLLVQNCVRQRKNPYVYLEIGSLRGGTLQLHYMDLRCNRIYSIDKRPLAQPDNRKLRFRYVKNSTADMVANLLRCFPEINRSNREKLATFDFDVGHVPAERIAEKPDICFIDGEHTDPAAYADFRFCLTVSHPDGVILFHDAGIIQSAIKESKKFLRSNGIAFKGLMLAGSVYAVLLGNAIDAYGPTLVKIGQNEDRYFTKWRKKLCEILRH